MWGVLIALPNGSDGKVTPQTKNKTEKAQRTAALQAKKGRYGIGDRFSREVLFMCVFSVLFFEAPGFSVGMSAKTGRLTGADRRTAALAAFCRKGETVSGCFRKSFQYSLHIRRKTPAFCCSSSIKIFSEKNEKSSLSKSYQKRRKTAKTRETHIDNRKMRKSLLTSPPPCANIIEC